MGPTVDHAVIRRRAGRMGVEQALFALLFLSAAVMDLAAFPSSPVLRSPASNAVNVGSATLKVNVPDSGSSQVTVKFFGAPAPTSPGSNFALVALPDTQYYTDSANGGQPAMFYAQANWIVANQAASNIAYVAGLGDIVDHGDTNGGTPANEWKIATNAYYRLENPATTRLPFGIPYGATVGNHDQSPNGDPDGTTTFYNQYFGVSHFSARPYYGGHYGTNNNNHFDLFSASGLDFVVVYIEFDDDVVHPEWLVWANTILQTYSTRRAIVVSHHIIGLDGTFGPSGQAIYNALKANANLFLMLCGHIGDNGENSRADVYNGHTVYTLLSDYQGRTNGGNGMLREMTFSPSNNVIQVQTYSPWTGLYETDADSLFTLSYNMQPVQSFLPIHTNSVASGSDASFVWTNLLPNATYNWYVTVSDSNTLVGPTWRFSTAASNSAPVAAPLNATINPDAGTNMVLTASDANTGDLLTFRLERLPSEGFISAFDPSTGQFTYEPAHGYWGADSFTFSASDGQLSSAVATVSLNVQAPVDADGDGIPDDWEAKYGITNAAGDADGDGQNNRQEYLANTDPTNPASNFHLTGAVLNAGNQAVITWASIGGTRYRVQYSDGDAEGGVGPAFSDIVRPAAVEIDPTPIGASSSQSFTDDFSLTGGPSAHGARYYRVKVIP